MNLFGVENLEDAVKRIFLDICGSSCRSGSGGLLSGISEQALCSLSCRHCRSDRLNRTLRSNGSGGSNRSKNLLLSVCLFKSGGNNSNTDLVLTR